MPHKREASTSLFFRARAGAHRFQLRDKYPKREYCTQYGESD